MKFWPSEKLVGFFCLLWWGLEFYFPGDLMHSLQYMKQADVSCFEKVK